MKQKKLPVRLIGDISFFKENWFVLGEKGAKYGLYASQDLLTWKMVPFRFANHARLKKAGGKLFCFRHPYCGEQSAFCDMMYSENGFDWEPLVFDLENGNPHYVVDIFFENNHWIFLGESQKQSNSFKNGCFFCSADLANWKMLNSSIGYPKYNSLTLAYGNGLLVSTARNMAGEYAVLFSSDFCSWRKVRVPENLPENLCHFKNTFFAFSPDLSSCFFSQDALSWHLHEAKNSGVSHLAKGVWPIFINNTVALRPSISGNDIFISCDFLEWRKKELPFRMHSCAENEESIVFVSSSGEFFKTDLIFLE